MHFTTTQTEHQLVIEPDKRKVGLWLLKALAQMVVVLVVVLVWVEYFDAPKGFALVILVWPLFRLGKLVSALRTFFSGRTYVFDKNTRQFLVHNTEERSFEGIEAISLVYVDYMATQTIFLSLNYTNSWLASPNS